MFWILNVWIRTEISVYNGNSKWLQHSYRELWTIAAKLIPSAVMRCYAQNNSKFVPIDPTTEVSLFIFNFLLKIFAYQEYIRLFSISAAVLLLILRRHIICLHKSFIDNDVSSTPFWVYLGVVPPTTIYRGHQLVTKNLYDHRTSWILWSRLYSCEIWLCFGI